MDSIDARLRPPFWRHDGYTLDCLQRGIREAVEGTIRGRLSNHERALVVDIGAGSAPYRTIFESFGAKYVTCDMVGDGIDDSALPDITLLSGQEIDLRSNSADWVVSFQVLEHVWDLDWYLGECRRILKDDGVLLLSTHGTWLFHPHPTDFRRWTRDGLREELCSRGFDVVSMTPIVGPLAWTTQFRSLAYHHVLSRLPVFGKMLSAFVCTFMNIRMKIEDRVTPKAQLANNAAVYIVLARVSRTV